MLRSYNIHSSAWPQASSKAQSVMSNSFDILMFDLELVWKFKKIRQKTNVEFNWDSV